MIWIEASISPAHEPMVEINVSGNELLVLRNILIHASEQYTHGRTATNKAYAETVRNLANNWLERVELRENEAAQRKG